MNLSDRNPKNIHGVRRKQWASWTLVAKHVFNKTYDDMMRNPEINVTPGSVVDLKSYGVTVWNAAFVAACVCSRGERYLLKDVD